MRYEGSAPIPLALPLSLERRQHRSQIVGQRRARAERLTRVGPVERQRVRVKEHALQPERFEIRVEVLVAVTLVAGHRVASVHGMDTDLMRASGLDGNLEQRRGLAVTLDE